MSSLRIGIVSLMVGLGTLGCSGEGSPAEPSGATELANDNGDPKGDPGKGDQGEPLDDRQIATVIHAVNQGEIQEARFALQRASNPDVRDFASRMIMEHMQVDEKLRGIVSDTGGGGDDYPRRNHPPDDEFPASPSHVSRLLERQVVLDLQQLRPIDAPDFDLGYITKQVAAHAGVLGIMHQMLLPSVQMPELRQLIEETEPAVTMHLQSATGITQGMITTQD